MKIIAESISVILAISSVSLTLGFVLQNPSRSIQSTTTTTSSSSSPRLPTHLYRDRYDKELEENAERKARQTADGSGGGAVAGVLIGGLLGGPFGEIMIRICYFSIHKISLIIFSMKHYFSFIF